MKTIALLAMTAAAGLAAISSTTPASARGGSQGGGLGESYLNDEVKNPRYIEPGGWADPTRYRIGNPYAGYEDRQLAAQGIYNEGSGYYPPHPRGRVFVQPYYAR